MMTVDESKPTTGAEATVTAEEKLEVAKANKAKTKVASLKGVKAPTAILRAGNSKRAKANSAKGKATKKTSVGVIKADVAELTKDVKEYCEKAQEQGEVTERERREAEKVRALVENPATSRQEAINAADTKAGTHADAAKRASQDARGWAEQTGRAAGKASEEADQLLRKGAVTQSSVSAAKKLIASYTEQANKAKRDAAGDATAASVAAYDAVISSRKKVG